ncbi:DUF4876 domain-containing protein [Carboxylicivirga sp. N1Y90]|uniref:DUF4876 domain-containing protein n=1 Tax=Carboxylicivirga fragile TaxID=3417571 RepID=UPI003D32FDDC|nr:DUF4876 domain-containing protein [Marinilabiliaceae bacterium N1Y90]
MKKTFLLQLLLAIAIMTTCYSCEDDEVTPVTTLEIQVTIPDELVEEEKEGLNVTLSSQSTNKTYTGVTDLNGYVQIVVNEGIYNLQVNSNMEYATSYLVGSIENLSVIGATQKESVDLMVSIVSNSWVLKELYFTGSRTPEDKSYYKDKYFELVNNSDVPLYADGISLCESDGGTYSDVYEWESIVSLNDAFVAGTVYTIPGDGDDYLIQPGESVILADLAINHTLENANSYDLSHADFEWYDEHKLDSDVPEVPNMIKNFSYSASIWTPHNRGFKSYVIFKAEGSMESFITNNTIEGQTASGIPKFRVKVPNDLILDAVEMSTPTSFTTKVLSSSLDAGWAHCGDEGTERYGKCVRRKVEKVVDGRKVYQDTNNSTNDFEATVTPMPGK